LAKVFKSFVALGVIIMVKKIKKLESKYSGSLEYKKFFTSLRSKKIKAFDKENKDLLLSELLTALNEKDAEVASELYEKFKEAVS